MNFSAELLLTTVYLPLCAHLALGRSAMPDLPGNLSLFGMLTFLGAWFASVDGFGVYGANLFATWVLTGFVVLVALGWWWQDFQALRDARKAGAHGRPDRRHRLASLRLGPPVH